MNEHLELFQSKDRYNHLKAIADERGYPFPFHEDQPLDLMHFVASGLTPLVGTEAETAEPLLKTRLAGVICRKYLLRLVGVPFEARKPVGRLPDRPEGIPLVPLGA